MHRIASHYSLSEAPPEESNRLFDCGFDGIGIGGTGLDRNRPAARDLDLHAVRRNHLFCFTPPAKSVGTSRAPRKSFSSS